MQYLFWMTASARVEGLSSTLHLNALSFLRCLSWLLLLGGAGPDTRQVPQVSKEEAMSKDPSKAFAWPLSTESTIWTLDVHPILSGLHGKKPLSAVNCPNLSQNRPAPDIPEHFQENESRLCRLSLLGTRPGLLNYLFRVETKRPTSALEKLNDNRWGIMRST